MRFRLVYAALAIVAAPVPALANGVDNPYPALRVMDGRVAAIEYRLRQSNVEWCAAKTEDAGFRSISTLDVPKKFLPIMLKAYDADTGFTGSLVSAVIPQSFAAQSGARVGEDQGIALNRIIARAPNLGRTHCAANVSVVARDDMYAATDGFAVQISAALINRTRDDDELAALIAHELAHIILDHPGTLKGKRSISRVKSTERDADRLSVWLMARAGYDPMAAVRFWTHYGPRRDKGIFNAPTHDNWKNRVARLTSEITAMRVAQAADKNARPTISGLRTYP